MLSRLYGWTPQEIARMTHAQQMMYLEASGDGNTITFDTVAEARAYQHSVAKGRR